jgi:hypothetical protein
MCATAGCLTAPGVYIRHHKGSYWDRRFTFAITKDLTGPGGLHSPSLKLLRGQEVYIRHHKSSYGARRFTFAITKAPTWPGYSYPPTQKLLRNQEIHILHHRICYGINRFTSGITESVTELGDSPGDLYLSSKNAVRIREIHIHYHIKSPS